MLMVWLLVLAAVSLPLPVLTALELTNVAARCRWPYWPDSSSLSRGPSGICGTNILIVGAIATPRERIADERALLPGGSGVSERHGSHLLRHSAYATAWESA